MVEEVDSPAEAVEAVEAAADSLLGTRDYY